MGNWIGLGIQILVFVGAVITLYVNSRLKTQALETRIENAEKELQEHLKDQQPKCLENFEKFKLDIAAIKQRENYEAEIVSKILQPILEKLALEMKQYTDFKVDTIQQEIRVYTADNHEIKEGNKELIKILTEKFK